jgi:hypothetical protein
LKGCSLTSLKNLAQSWYYLGEKGEKTGHRCLETSYRPVLTLLYIRQLYIKNYSTQSREVPFRVVLNQFGVARSPAPHITFGASNHYSYTITKKQAAQFILQQVLLAAPHLYAYMLRAGK